VQDFKGAVAVAACPAPEEIAPRQQFDLHTLGQTGRKCNNDRYLINNRGHKPRADRARSQRLARRADGSHYHQKLGVDRLAIRVPQNARLEPAQNDNSACFDKDLPVKWAESQKCGPLYRVLCSSQITRSGAYWCSDESCAYDVETAINAVAFIESDSRDRDPATDLAIVMVTSSAPRALDGDRVAHCSNVGKQIVKKCQNVGIEKPLVLRVNEQDVTGLHAHFVFAFPREHLSRLEAIGKQENVKRFDLPDGTGKALTVKDSASYKKGVPGLCGYLGKAICRRGELDAGGSKVMPNDALARAMFDASLLEPRSLQRPKRNLPRAIASNG
jgi:hypothetical protein